MAARGRGRSWRRYASLWAAVTTTAVLLAACEAPWSAPAGPITAGGARMSDDGQLDFWLGAECDAVAEVQVELAESGDGRVLDTWRLRAEDPEGAVLERFTIGMPPDGFRETKALTADWTEAEVVRISLHAADGQAGDGDDRRFYPEVPVRSYVSTERVLNDAADHQDEWYVQDQGWFSEPEYAALANDDDMIYPYCAVPNLP